MCQPFDSKSVKLRLDVEAMAAAADADIYTFGGAIAAVLPCAGYVAAAELDASACV